MATNRIHKISNLQINLLYDKHIHFHISGLLSFNLVLAIVQMFDSFDAVPLLVGQAESVKNSKHHDNRGMWRLGRAPWARLTLGWGVGAVPQGI
jgi:hypothetical protein